MLNLKGVIRPDSSQVSGFFVFSHSRMMGYFRLGQVRVNECPPARLDNWPYRVRAFHRDQKQEKIYCENMKKSATSDSSLDLIYLLFLGVNVSIGIVQQYIIPSVVNSLVPFAKMELGIASERLLKVMSINHCVLEKRRSLR